MFEIILIMIVTTLSCALLGSILVLTNQSMIADALSHSVLLGIVLGFFVAKSLDSPLLWLGAALFGLLTVYFIDRLMAHSSINHDTATGLVFPFFFAIAVILISSFASNVHLDIDMVLMGEVIFSSLNRLDFWGFDLPVSLVKGLGLLALNLIFLFTYYHRLKIYLFDRQQAQLMGISTRKLSFIITLLVSLTTVIAFDTLGSITVICFFVAPAMTLLFKTKSYGKLLLGSSLVCALACVLGTLGAHALDVTISGFTVCVSLLIFLFSLLFKKA